MTKEQAVIKLRSHIQALRLKEHFAKLSGGRMYLDTLHKPSCKGCPTGTSCGCTIAHPNLFFECSRDLSSEALYLAKSEQGKTHLFVPLEFEGDLAGYIRLEKHPDQEPVGKLASIKKYIPSVEGSLHLDEFKQLFSDVMQDGHDSAESIMAWINEAVENLNRTLKDFSASTAPAH